jgi:predicted CoA-binding protein
MSIIKKANTDIAIIDIFRKAIFNADFLNQHVKPIYNELTIKQKKMITKMEQDITKYLEEKCSNKDMIIFSLMNVIVSQMTNSLFLIMRSDDKDQR